MSSVILEFDLPREDVILGKDKVAIELGNGVRLTTGIPSWVIAVNSAKLQIVLDIEGGPPNANIGTTPEQRVHEAPPDGGLEVGEDGGTGTPDKEVQTKDT